MEAKPREMIVLYDADGVNEWEPKKLKLLICIPDENWVEILNHPEELLTVMQEALITAIRALAKPGDDLIHWINQSSDEMRKRVRRSENDDVRVMPLSYLRPSDHQGNDA